MARDMGNTFVIFLITAIAGLVGIGLRLYLSVGIFEAVVVGALVFCMLLVLYNNFILQRHTTRVDRHFIDTFQFEQSIAERLKKFETMADTSQLPPAASGSNQLSKQGQSMGILTEISNPNKKFAKTPANFTNNVHDNDQPAADNIIALKNRLRPVEKPNVAKTFKIKPSQLTKALNKGGAGLFLQPILQLPSRDIRYFEALIRLRIDDNVLTARQFIPAAKNNEQIARIDSVSLDLVFKALRGLRRQDNDNPVFWNISPQSLKSKKLFAPMLEQLRANKPLNQQLICEIPYATFKKLNRAQNDNLASIRDLGYRLSLDQFTSDENFTIGKSSDKSGENIFERGLFSFVKVPAMELMRIGEGDITNFADYIVQVAAHHNITLIGSEVENDTQTACLIDADIYLAQGNAVMPAKALKKELGGV